MIALEPCRAGFDGCDAMRAEGARKHPRTPSVRECRHLPIPEERAELLRGPEIGTLCLYQSPHRVGPVVVRVLARSYVWGPGDPAYRGGARRYDWSVIALDPGATRTLVADDAHLSPITEGMRLGPVPVDHCAYCDKEIPRLAVQSHHHYEAPA